MCAFLSNLFSCSDHPVVLYAGFFRLKSADRAFAIAPQWMAKEHCIKLNTLYLNMNSVALPWAASVFFYFGWPYFHPLYLFQYSLSFSLAKK